MKRVIVLGIGNILLSDEGFGVRVVEHLVSRFKFPAGVEILDGGTMGYELLRFIHDAERLILIDAVNGSQPPGTMFCLADDEVKAYYRQKVSMHQLGIQEVLAMLDITGRTVNEVRLVGVQPASLAMSLDLSSEVQPLVEKAAAAVIDILEVWGIPCHS